MNYLIKTGVFSLVGNYLRPSNNYRQSIFNINAVVLKLIICRFTKMVKNIYVNLSIFTVFLKNRNFTSKIKRSKVTDYAALNMLKVYCFWSCVPWTQATCLFCVPTIFVAYLDIITA